MLFNVSFTGSTYVFFLRHFVVRSRSARLLFPCFLPHFFSVVLFPLVHVRLSCSLSPKVGMAAAGGGVLLFLSGGVAAPSVTASLSAVGYVGKKNANDVETQVFRGAYSNQNPPTQISYTSGCLHTKFGYECYVPRTSWRLRFGPLTDRRPALKRVY